MTAPAPAPPAAPAPTWSVSAARRVAWAFLTAGWLGLLASYAGLLVPGVSAVHHLFFPAPLMLPALAGGTVVAATGSAALAALSPRPAAGRWAAGVGMGASALLLLHASTFADAAFWGTFWVSAWLLWAHGVPAEEVRRVGPRLAQAVLALAFFGGAVGKLTAGYWSGDVFYGLFFGSDITFFPALNRALSPLVYRDVATFVSQMAILAEWLVALSVVLPTPWSLRLVLAVAAGMCAFFNPALAVLMLPLAGLALGGLLLEERGSGGAPNPVAVCRCDAKSD